MATDDERQRRIGEELQKDIRREQYQREQREKQASDDSARIIREIEDKQRDWKPPKK